MIEMTNMKNKMWAILIVIGALLIVSALPMAIKYFFRLFLLMLENPLEATCFFGLLTLLSFGLTKLSELEKEG